MGERGQANIKQRSDGRWEARLQVNGRRLSAYGISKAEVNAKLKQLEKDAIVKGGFAENHKLFELLDKWVEVESHNWKPATRRDYNWHISILKKELGNIPLAKITPLLLRTLYSKFKEFPRKTLKLHQTIHRALNLALEWEWLLRNPAARVRPRYEEAEKQLWTIKEVREFLAQTREDDWWPVFSFALFTGLRVGELAALEWNDFDEENKTIRVSKTIHRIESKWITGTPKTKAGRRLIYLEPTAIEALERQRQLSGRWKTERGPWTESQRIFTNKYGNPLLSTSCDHALQKLCKELNLPGISMHGLRHLNASLAIEGGAALTLVSKHLGHANPHITAQIYLRALSETKAVGQSLTKVLSEG